MRSNFSTSLRQAGDFVSPLIVIFVTRLFKKREHLLIRCSKITRTGWGIEIMRKEPVQSSTEQERQEQTIFATQVPDQFICASGLLELGTRFYAKVAGNITKVRIYTNALEEGSHIVRIWRVADAEILAGPYIWNFPPGCAGWKTYTLPSPLAVEPYVEYIVSVSTGEDQHYAYSDGGFRLPICNGNLITVTGSGLYHPNPGSMPAWSYKDGNYFRDVVFVPKRDASPSCVPAPPAYSEYSDLPEGNNGIAANYPGDLGIHEDANVIFADDFESYNDVKDLFRNWSRIDHIEYVRITDNPDDVYHGGKAVELFIPKQSSELSVALVKDKLFPEYDTLFVRYYSKFDKSFDVSGSSHNGSAISAHYYDFGASPGIPGNGLNKFLVSLENWREGGDGYPNPGRLNVYVYHPEQRDVWGDHFFPTGNVLPYTNRSFDFGPTFVRRPDVIPELGRWYCYEYMVKANTPGMRDGRIAIWIDGKLVADFKNLRLRDTSILKINRFSLDFHIKNNLSMPARKWYDNVVVATSYIGPMS